MVSAVRGKHLSLIVGKLLLIYLYGAGPRMIQKYFPLMDGLLWGSYFGQKRIEVEEEEA